MNHVVRVFLLNVETILLYKLSFALKNLLTNELLKNYYLWTSLVVQWLRIRLPTRGTWV